VRHDAHGWWIDEAGAPAPLPALAEDLSADVLVVGGGYTGMWTAWHAAEAGASVVVLEADRCGFGPSGRNGGFVSTLWLSYPSLEARFGRDGALAVCRASSETVRAIGAWCREQEVDAWYREAQHLVVSTCPAQDGVSADAVDGKEVVEASPEQRAISPVFRGGVAAQVGATVQPARLAFGLRERLLGRGVRIFEGSRVRALQGTTARTDGGSVRASAAVVAIGGAVASTLRDRLTVSSSHIVLTEPVPDLVWPGGEAISDGRALLHYFRTTRDGRIVFGWGGGRMACGARLRGRMEVDPDIVATAARDLERIFPGFRGRRIERAWGGPIDVSPAHLPSIVTLGARAWAAFGYTGNGVGPSHMLGGVLAELAGGGHPAFPLIDPPFGRVPPEPLRVAGAALIRRALVRKEALEEAERAVDPLTAAIARVPELMGVHIVR
jgi:glycine/D-amino acid oxidase-like deaminating enzyme